MADGFFRELQHYSLYEIANELHISEEKARRLISILKEYGVVKSAKSSEMEYMFDFVGIVMAEETVFKCYPKYISSTKEPMRQLKQVLRVIKKCNDKEQLVYPYNGEAEHKIFNRLAVGLYLLEDYFQYGLYTNLQEIVETNGEGRILWDRTINDTFPLLFHNHPYYLELRTHHVMNDEADYIKRLHECVLTLCAEELKDSGILELFDIAEVELTNARLDDFGDVDYIKYRLEKEIQTQYVTRKRTLLKTIYTYVANEKANQEDLSFSFYGTNKYYRVWEKVCAENFGNMLNVKLSELPPGLSDEYQERKNEKLIDIIEKPIWHKTTPEIVDDRADTLRPDCIHIYPVQDGTGEVEYCFGIYDAKYYCIDFKKTKAGYQVTGQPGVADITKQYLYQLAYDDFIIKQGYRYVQNVFLCPQEDSEPDYGYVEMKMLHKIGDKILENIAVVKLCAEKMYDIYLADGSVENIQEFLFFCHFSHHDI